MTPPRTTRPRHARSWRPLPAIAVAVAAAVVAAACGTDDAAAPEEAAADADRVVLVTYDSFALPEDAATEFTERTGAEIEVVTAGDSGTMLTRALLAAGSPEGDVIFGIDNTLAGARAQRGPARAVRTRRARPCARAVPPRRRARRAADPDRHGRRLHERRRRVVRRRGSRAPQRPSRTWPTPRTRTCSSSRARSPRPRGWPSCSERSTATARTGGPTTGRASTPTACASDRAGTTRTPPTTRSRAGIAPSCCPTRRARRPRSSSARVRGPSPPPR